MTSAREVSTNLRYSLHISIILAREMSKHKFTRLYEENNETMCVKSVTINFIMWTMILLTL